MTKDRPREPPAPEMGVRLARRQRPQSRENLLLTLQRAAGKVAVGRLLARQPEDEKRRHYPWIGEIHGTWASALRGSPGKKADDPHTTRSPTFPAAPRSGS